MLAETLKAAVFGSCEKIIPVTHGVAPSNKNNQRGITGINSWIPRWNTPATPPSQETSSAEPLTRSNALSKSP